MEFNKKNVKVIGGLILFGIVCYVALQHLENITGFLALILGVCAPFLFGGALAFVINLPMTFIEDHLFGRVKSRAGAVLARQKELTVEEGETAPDEKKLKKESRLAAALLAGARPISMLLAIILVVGVFAAVIFLVIPSLSESVGSVVEGIRQSVPRFQRWIREVTDNNPKVTEMVLSFDINNINTEKIWNVFQGVAGNTLEFTYSLALGVSHGVMNFFFGLVFALNLLVGKEKLAHQAKKVLYACLPREKAGSTIRVFSMINRAFSKFITGQCLEACILGACFFLVLTLFRFPYAMLLSLIIGVMSVIPIVGATIGCILSVLILITVDPMQAILFVVLFLVMQQLEAMFIYPNVVGESIGLPAIWVLVAVIVGGDLFGILGMLLFIPLTSVAYALFSEWVNGRLKKKKHMPAGHDNG